MHDDHGSMDTPGDDRILARLHDLGLTLPQVPDPVAAYVPSVRTGNLIFVSGQVPFRDGELVATGAVPSESSLDEAVLAARQCGLNALAVVARELGGRLDPIRRIVRVGVFVLSDAGFREQPRVADGVSELLVEILGDRGRHARAAVGCPALPLGATVEVEMVVEV